MIETKHEVFIASRFEEFKEIRAKLRDKINQYKFIEAVDLNNNEASHRSPLEESLFYVRKSEIMVLLVGETYGTIPDGEDYSYTHLEYKQAIEDISNTRVLVFCVGESYSGEMIEYSEDKYMSSWQKELESNHRLKKFSGTEDTDYIVEKIFIDISSSLYDLSLGDVQDINLEKKDDAIEVNLEEDDEDFLENSEVLFLDSKNMEVEGVELIDSSDENIEGFELLKIPSKLAAIEQKKEAQYAIDLRDYATAIKHLKNALELRPLDFESNYWLAKLYITSAKKSLFFEIEEYLLRAAKIAEKQNNVYKASHCYQLIVQASIFSDKKNEGLKYISLAQELTPSFSRLFYEKSKLMLYFDMQEKAKFALIETINIKMESVELIENDPFFKNYETFINDVFSDLKNSLHKTCLGILHETNNIRSLFNLRELEINLREDNITQLWKKARNAVVNQYSVLKYQINNTSSSEIDQLKEIMESNIKEEEKNIEVLTYSKKQELNNLEKEYDSKLDELEEQENKKKLDEELNINSTKSTHKYASIFAIFFGVISTYYILNNNVDKMAFGIPLVMVVVILYSMFDMNKLNKKLKDIIDGLDKSYILKKESLLNDKKESVENLEVRLKKEIETINQNIEKLKLKYEEDTNKLKLRYENISSAFKVFEEKTLTISHYKYVPFKSLKKASVGSIVRVTSYSYNNYIESGGTIEIIDDVPEYLNIPKANIEDYAILAKVVKRWKNYIQLSRIDAYRGFNDNPRVSNVDNVKSIISNVKDERKQIVDTTKSSFGLGVQYQYKKEISNK